MFTPADQPEPVEISFEAQERIKELQRLVTESQRKAAKSKDEDIVEAHNLQMASLGLKISRIRRGLPEDAPPEAEKEVEEDLEPLPESTPAQLHEADMLVQRAALEKRRGNNQAAADLLKKAADTAPGASPVLEALGDDYMERRQYKAALDSYKKALRADPNNASADRKYAGLSSQGLATMSPEDFLRLGSADPLLIQKGEALGNPKLAVAFSAFIPGSGQLVMGQSKKGIAILCTFFGSAILFAILSTLIKHDAKSIPSIAYFPLAIAVVTYFVSIADAAQTAKSVEKRAAPSKPVPPVNLPFE